jgi:hypothetical protein
MKWGVFRAAIIAASFSCAAVAIAATTRTDGDREGAKTTPAVDGGARRLVTAPDGGVAKAAAAAELSVGGPPAVDGGDGGPTTSGDGDDGGPPVVSGEGGGSQVDGGDGGLAPAPDAGVVGCSGSSHVCFVGGALLASFSITDMGHGSDRAGSTAHRMVAIAMPMLGVRWAPIGVISIDFLAYTALVPTQTVNSAPANINGCHANGNTFESLLPCEGNATITPVLGFFLPALTVSASPNFSAVSVGPTYGLARTNQDSALHGFFALLVTVGAAQLAVGIP